MYAPKAAPRTPIIIAITFKAFFIKSTSVFNSLKVLYPKKSKLIKEAKWYNVVGDILGIVDPTGIVDIVNGFL